MATTSAPRSWAAVTRRALAVTGAATVALVALAVPASAHTYSVSADCTKDNQVDLNIDLKAYKTTEADKTPNTVLVKDGDKVIINERFGKEWSLDDAEVAALELDATVAHKFTVQVRAWDDKDGVEGKKYDYSFDAYPESPACKKAEQPPAEQPPAEQPPAQQPPAETPPAPTTTTTAAVGVNANLAETGASIALPIGIGALLLIGGAGLLLVLRRRDKSGKA